MKVLKFLPVLALAFLVFACAAQIPQADVDAANAAFAAAKTAGADVYAADSFKAASDANDALQANITAKDFGKTKDLAKTVTDDSNKAASDAAAGLEAFKADVAKLTTDVAAEADSTKAELALAVKAGKKAKIDVKKAQADLDAAVKTSADSKADVDAGKFGDAKTKLTAAKTGLDAVKTVLETAGFKK